MSFAWYTCRGSHRVCCVVDLLADASGFNPPRTSFLSNSTPLSTPLPTTSVIPSIVTPPLSTKEACLSLASIPLYRGTAKAALRLRGVSSRTRIPSLRSPVPARWSVMTTMMRELPLIRRIRSAELTGSLALISRILTMVLVTSSMTTRMPSTMTLSAVASVILRPSARILISSERLQL